MVVVESTDGAILRWVNVTEDDDTPRGNGRGTIQAAPVGATTRIMAATRAGRRIIVAFLVGIIIIIRYFYLYLYIEQIALNFEPCSAWLVDECEYRYELRDGNQADVINMNRVPFAPDSDVSRQSVEVKKQSREHNGCVVDISLSSDNSR